MPFVREEVFCIRLNSRNLNTVMCFADRSGIGRADIREEPVESLFTILHQWNPDLWEGCMGREYSQHPKFSADSQLLWSWCLQWESALCAQQCYLWSSPVWEQVSGDSCSCMERCSAALLGDTETEHSSPLSQELWPTFILHKAQTSFFNVVLCLPDAAKL